LSLLNCAGSPRGNPARRTGYRAGLPVFAGVSGSPYLSKDRALALALQDAARQASFFHSVKAVINSSETYNPRLRISRITEERELVYDTDYEKYIPLLEFDAKRDVYEEHGALFVRAAYTGGTGGAAGYRRRAGGGKPSWVGNPPAKRGGLICAVGVSGPRLSYKDAVVASYEDAAYAFVKSGFSETYASQQAENSLVDTASVFVSGVVKGFQVLETWRDPASGAVWTLAAAREVKRQ
jgi:hypothetical protein